MSRTIVITMMTRDTDRHGIPCGKPYMVASHGVDEVTLEAVCLPSEHPSALGARFDAEIGEWVIDRIRRYL